MGGVPYWAGAVIILSDLKAYIRRNTGPGIMLMLPEEETHNTASRKAMYTLHRQSELYMNLA